MQIGVPRETAAGETRVAATPETVKKLKAQGHTIRVESGAGVAASVVDDAYVAAGADIVDRAGALGSDLVLKVRSPSADELALMKSGANLVGMLNPFDRAGLDALAAAGLTSFALEAAPRTTRAQSMDVLSSQANIAGYKAVMIAADQYQRFFPMLMTAAGTVKAARVVILGVGVAGLQAIATAKRLGAVIEASDVRPSVKEQVESLGGKFIDVPYETPEEKEAAEGVGGYARADAAELARPAEGRGRQARRRRRRRHQHGADPGPRRADADHRGDGQGDEAGLGDRRHRRRQGPGRRRRQLPAERGRPDRRPHGVTIVGETNLRGAGRRRRLGALRAQRARLPQARADQGRRLRGADGRRHRRRLPDDARRRSQARLNEPNEHRTRAQPWTSSPTPSST